MLEPRPSDAEVNMLEGRCHCGRVGWRFDGVLECRNASGEEFGTDRLIEALRGIEKQSAQTTLMMLLAAVQDFANGLPLCDDVSLTVIQRDAAGTSVA